MGRATYRRFTGVINYHGLKMNDIAQNPPNLNLVLDVPVSLTIELGGCQLPMREVLQLNIGSVVQLDKPADAPVELSINGKLIARGEVVVIEERYGVKITEVIGSVIAV
jgi:flagellar motor switch protein FliN